MLKKFGISAVFSAVLATSVGATSLGLTPVTQLSEGTGDGIMRYDSGFGILSEDFFSPGSLGIFTGAQAGSSLTVSIGAFSDSVGIEGTANSADIKEIGFSDDTLELLLDGDLLGTGDTALLLLITQQNPAFDFSTATETSGLPFSYFDALPTDALGFATLNNIGFTISTIVAPVPLPAGAMLLLTGMGGLIVMRRRKAA